MRRQKGTVWSERAQFEDPRITAQQRAARIRANREIIGSSSGSSAYLGGFPGGPGSGRTSTGLSSAGGKVAAKIRHHGKSSTLGIGGYGADSNYVGIGGVPLRLSATEVEPEDSEDEETGFMARAPNHRRTGSSGRSSTASGRRGPPYRTSTGALNPTSGTNSLQGKTPERPGSLVDDTALPRDDAASGKARSTASGSSAERADNVPDLAAAGAGRVAAAAANSSANATLTRERSTRNPEDLRRRGSVDERTMTLSTGRLFIANPD
ncbi:hypothetical protein F503_08398 [Ophiostoma piceae UAMH 11346]|uniref:Uncharacterized protein n=1 Tax=Ophiostoma piceae (strain UAMH 11346) TaxID=1262450 RepID=S3BZB5_OPHP1|nr:hypothetical protein F503_08398 [Ophiostoma piceae UAMH 11346]